MQVGTVNVYLFSDPEPVLVDTGIKSAESWDALQEGLAEHGLTVLDLSRVIITHAHVDHDGQAGTIVANSDADVWISDAGAPWLLEMGERQERRMRYYREDFLPATGLSQSANEMIMYGLSAMAKQRDPLPAERICSFRRDGVLQMGGKTWQVIFTPGHASMQTCFYEPETRLLLSADMLLAVTPVPVVESPPMGLSERVPALPLFMESLNLVEALDVEIVLPGHGRPFQQHREVIQRQRERILARKDECLAWINEGSSTLVELLDKMYAHRPIEMRFAGLWMLVGYLDLLKLDGAIEQHTINGIWHYSPHSER
jgi:glyoxylase-like metal-dependent hydrolase (beta-lactamase superfamily II)